MFPVEFSSWDFWGHMNLSAIWEEPFLLRALEGQLSPKWSISPVTVGFELEQSGKEQILRHFNAQTEKNQNKQSQPMNACWTWVENGAASAP